MSAASLQQVLNLSRDLELDITPAMLWKWVERGKVRHYGRDAYDIDDVAREVQRIIRLRVGLDDESKACQGSARRGVST